MLEEAVTMLKPDAFKAPEFYAAKEGMREASPDAEMIELAEGALTIVLEGTAHKLFVLKRPLSCCQRALS